MKIDYIIVGLGIGGIALCEQLLKREKSFMVFDNNKECATQISGGLVNPVVLNTFKLAGEIQEFKSVKIFYESLAKKLKVDLIFENPIFRVLKSVADQNLWASASDKIAMDSVMEGNILADISSAIKTPFGSGKVYGSALINTFTLLEKYREYLLSQNILREEEFDYDLIQEKNGKIIYADITAFKIIFAEGISAIHNPFLQKNILVPSKGEYLIINSPHLKLKEILKGKYFIIPLENDLYKVGATYKRDDLTWNSTVVAKEEIKGFIEETITCKYQIIKQIAGVRPTTKDRNPIIGTSIHNKNISFLNGLGSRGLTLAPQLAKLLLNFLEDDQVIPKEVSISRFD